MAYNDFEEYFLSPQERARRMANASLGMPILPNLPGLGTGESSYQANHGSAPYAEAAQRARGRLGLQDRLLAALSGFASAQGPSFGQSFLTSLGGSARATWAAKQAAMNYAQRQQEQQQQAEMDDIRKKFMEAQAAAMSKPPAEPKPEKPAPPPKPEKLVTVAGPNGQPVYVRESDAVGKSPYIKPAAPGKAAAVKPPRAPKPPTAGERRSSGALSRAEGLDRQAASIEANLSPIDMVRLKTPYAIQTLKEKQYTNARRAFTETVLREFSGAAISKDEYLKYDQIFFAQPGDSKDTLAQKRKARAGILAQLRSMSGSAKDMGLSGLDALIGGTKAGSSNKDPLGVR